MHGAWLSLPYGIVKLWQEGSYRYWTSHIDPDGMSMHGARRREIRMTPAPANQRSSAAVMESLYYSFCLTIEYQQS